MDKLKEYIDLVRRGVPNIDKIAEGVLNQVKQEFGALPLDEQEEISRRRLICEACPLFSLNAKKDDKEYQKLFKTPFEFDSVRNTYCGSCGCEYKLRTSSLSSNCGLEHYNNLNQEDKQELKWTTYKTKK